VANVELSAKVAQVNFGRSPALSVGNRAAFGVMENELTVEVANQTLAKAKAPNRYTLFPGQEMPTAGTASITVNDYWLSRVSGGKKAWLYYFGDMTYLDEFGGQHRTTFCAVYNPTQRVFDHCTMFNEAN